MESPQTLVYRRSTHARRPPPGGPATAGQDSAGVLLLGRYRLIERLGAGGFGVVWEAHDELLDRVVALKRICLPAEIDRERATREALASARLAHPAIVSLYEAHAGDEEFCLVSELVRGRTLAQLIDTDELSDEQIAQIGVALAEALEHAHERGVVHRDVKPQNVLISDHSNGPDVVAKLADFGGAQLAGQDALTRTGDVLGTLAYMAPEQCDGLVADDRADLYSLALVLYEAFSGSNPVRGATAAETVRRIGGRITALERLRRDLPRPLTRALDIALAPRREQRGTLAQLREALSQELCEPHRQSPDYTRRQRIPPRDDPSAHTPEDRHEEPQLRHRFYELPRGYWWTCALALIGWQLAVGHLGVALLALAGAVPLALLPRRCGPGWIVCALSGALGLIGLAGVFPAICGAFRDWRARAGLGALGYWWLVLAEPLLGQRLWLGSPAGTPARSAWESSLSVTATHVIYPLFSLGVLLGGALWACASMLLPWIVRGRRLAFDVVLVTMWAALLVAAEPLLDSGSPTHPTAPDPRGLIGSALLAGLLTIGVRALRGPD